MDSYIAGGILKGKVYEQDMLYVRGVVRETPSGPKCTCRWKKLSVNHEAQ